MNNPYAYNIIWMTKNPYSFAEHFADFVGFKLEDLESWADADRFANELVDAANKGDDLSRYWISRLAIQGVTDTLLTDVSSRAGSVHVRSELVLDRKSRTFKWIAGKIKFNEYPSADQVCAMMVIYIIGAGIVHRIKQCGLDECGNFFTSNRKGLWCHDNCGSKYRARLARKRNRERQML